MTRNVPAPRCRERPRRAFAAAVLSCSALLPSVASAADSTAGEELYRRGLEAKEAGQAKEACRLFDESLREWEDPRPLFQVARCRMDEGDDLEAWRAYKRVAKYATERGRKASLLEAATALSELEPRLARVRVIVPRGAEGVRVKLDGADLSSDEWNDALPLPKGAHRVEATAPGSAPRAWSIEVSPGEVTDVVVVLDRVAPPPPPPPAVPPPAPKTEPAPRAERDRGEETMANAGLALIGFGSGGLLLGAAAGQLATDEPSERSDLERLSWAGVIAGSSGLAAGLTLLALRDEDERAAKQTSLGWMLLGLGSASLLGGAAAGVMGLETESDLALACPTGACPAEQQPNVDAYERLHALSGVGLAAGGALVGAGGLLLWLSEDEPAARLGGARNTSAFEVSPCLTPGGAGVVGRF